MPFTIGMRARWFLTVAFCGILFACAMMTKSNLVSHVTAASSTVTVPPPSTDLHKRFGLYHWAPHYPANEATTPNKLIYGANKVAAAGSRTIRIYLGAGDDYSVNPANNDPLSADYLKNIVASSVGDAYGVLFRDSRFDTFLLTTYSPGDHVANWIDGYTTTEEQLERSQIKALCDYLVGIDPGTGQTRFSNKNFIILNWEGDNAIAGANSRDGAWSDYKKWIIARTNGVKDSQAARPSGSTAMIYSGLEFNLVKRFDDAGVCHVCGSTVADPNKEDPYRYRCVLDYAAAAADVDVDYYSYSAYQTGDRKYDNPEMDLTARLSNDLTIALNKIKVNHPSITFANFIIGEFAYSRSNGRYGECNAAKYYKEFMDAASALGVSYTIAWQAVLDVFSDRDGTMTRVGTTFKNYLDYGGLVDPSLFSGCPRINVFEKVLPGLNVALAANGATATASSTHSSAYSASTVINGDRTGANWGNNGGWLDDFYGSYNVFPDWVEVNFGGSRSIYQINVFTVQDNYTSPAEPTEAMQFNYFGLVDFQVQYWDGTGWVTVPGGTITGNTNVWRKISFPDITTDRIRVYITRTSDGHSRITEIEAITDCPYGYMNPDGAVHAQTFSHYFSLNPDTDLGIFGTSFSSSGNTVRLRQADRELNASLLYQSPLQINASLPSGRRPGEAFVQVTSANNLDSNSQRVYLECPTCPLMRPQCAILNSSRGYSAVEFYPSDVAAVFGAGFSASGNQIKIESGGVTYTVTPAYEDPTQINFAVPSNIGSGQAKVYIRNNQNVESNEMFINVGPGLFESIYPVFPLVRTPRGILNTSWDDMGYYLPEFHASTLITIYGAHFSTSGNQVKVRQNQQEFTLIPSFQSDTKLKATLPSGLQPGIASLYVVDAGGRNSLPQYITISGNCPGTDCKPVIRDCDGVMGVNYKPEFHPGTVMAIFGYGFLSSGNQVLVIDSKGTTFVIQAGATSWYESLNQINASLPSNVSTGRATVIVRNTFNGVTRDSNYQQIDIRP